MVESDSTTYNSFIAETLEGRRMNITLDSDNLHYNNNSIYWTKKRPQKFAEFQRYGSIGSFAKKKVHCKVNGKVQKLQRKIPDGHEVVSWKSAQSLITGEN